jgi:hypothetical protein
MLNDPCNQQISQLSKNGRQHGKYNPRVLILTSTITNSISQAVTKAQATKIGRQKRMLNQPVVTKDQAVT